MGEQLQSLFNLGQNTTNTNDQTATNEQSVTGANDIFASQGTNNFLDGSNASMSNNWADGTFALNGKVYKLGCTVSYFVNNGWTVKSNSSVAYDTQVAANKSVYMAFTDGKMHDIFCYAINNTSTLKLINDCPIYAIYVENPNSNNGEQVPFELPLNIKNGSSKLEVESAYGKPNSSSTTSGIWKLEYTSGNKRLSIGSDKQGKVVGKFNFLDNDIKYANSKITTSTNTINSTNSTPSTNNTQSNTTNSQTSSWQSKTLKIKGATYKIGTAKLNDFLTKGWSLAGNYKGKENATVNGKARENTMTLQYTSGDKIVCGVINKDSNKKALKECIVYSIKNSSKMNFILPGNIQKGSTITKIKNTYGNPYSENQYEKQRYLDYTWNVTYEDFKTSYVKLQLKGDTGADYFEYTDYSYMVGK